MPIDSVATTARWMAAVRAHETRREDGLVHDRWAAVLAGTEGERWYIQRGDTPALSIIAVRARYFDEFLNRVTADHGVRQVVLLAAGFDTRAFRLAWPAGTAVFELDQPDVLAAKERVLRADGARPACERHVVEADLTKSWTEVLNRAGFRRTQPSCWLLEGFLFYLPADATERILDEVTRLSASGSWIGFDVPNAATLTHPWTRAWAEMQAKLGAPFVGTMEDPAASLAARGWTSAQVQAGDKDANYGRWPYGAVPIEVPDIPRHWFVTGWKD